MRLGEQQGWGGEQGGGERKGTILMVEQSELKGEEGDCEAVSTAPLQSEARNLK